MSKYISEYINQALIYNRIFPSYIGELLFNEGATTVEIKLNDEKIFFKFFFGLDIHQLEPETEFVNFCLSENIPTSNYFTIDNKILFSFELDSIKSSFYGTHYIGQTNTNSITSLLLHNTINFIGILHLKTVNFQSKLKSLQSITDYQKLFEFYTSNYLFFCQYDLSENIEYFLKNGVVQTKKYPIHSDFRFENIVFNNDSVTYLIDFSDIRLSYFEDDIGRLFQYLLYAKDVSISTIVKLIHEYEKFTGLKLEIKNLQSSIIYHLMFRFFFDIKSLSDSVFQERLIFKTKMIVNNIKDITYERGAV